ncbi:hypothetical protein [Nitrosospira briensis]|nr:hypothetical protein [Nitrosospira briensis]
MVKIIFWNVEHLSPAAVEIAQFALQAAERSAKQQEAAIAAAASVGGSEYGKITRAQTRSSTRSIAAASAAGNRFERAEARGYVVIERARMKAERLKKKLELSEDLTVSAPQVFFCEVLPNHPHSRSPLLGAAVAGGATLCYAHYAGGVSSPFTNCPITDGWYVGPVLVMSRVPKGLVINGRTSGAVRFCYWHAPSGNNGKIVAQMANGLNAGGQPFVLFGDLNAEPDDYAIWLHPNVRIMRPPGGTRISGRALDYAVTNCPTFLQDCRPLYSGRKNYEIKQDTGSDHMVMVFGLK